MFRKSIEFRSQYHFKIEISPTRPNPRLLVPYASLICLSRGVAPPASKPFPIRAASVWFSLFFVEKIGKSTFSRTRTRNYMYRYVNLNLPVKDIYERETAGLVFPTDSCQKQDRPSGPNRTKNRPWNSPHLETILGNREGGVCDFISQIFDQRVLDDFRFFEQHAVDSRVPNVTQSAWIDCMIFEFSRKPKIPLSKSTFANQIFQSFCLGEE